jgi:hypothetical protein
VESTESLLGDLLLLLYIHHTLVDYVVLEDEHNEVDSVVVVEVKMEGYQMELHFPHEESFFGIRFPTADLNAFALALWPF